MEELMGQLRETNQQARQHGKVKRINREMEVAEGPPADKEESNDGEIEVRFTFLTYSRDSFSD